MRCALCTFAAGEPRAPVCMHARSSESCSPVQFTRVYVMHPSMQTASCAAVAADSSRRTLVNTAATSAPSETSALYSSFHVAPPDGTHQPVTADAERRDDVGSYASAHTVDAQADRNRAADHEGCPSCPRSPAGSTRSVASDTIARSSSAAGVAAVLPTPPTTPGNSYAV